MNTIDYGKDMQTRMIAWKAKMKDITLKVVSHGSKEKVSCNNQDRNMPITKMAPPIEQLKNERRTEGTLQRENINNGIVDRCGKYVLRPRLSWTGLYGKEPWPRERKLWEKV
jgi:hypothetical protein